MARRSKSGKGSMRLARYIASAGVSARRKAEDLIRDGLVAVNGKMVTDVATNVVSGRDSVSVNGKAVVPQPLFYALFNKPKGCITALSDPWDRPTVMDYLPKLPAKIKPVGRLDYYSEGVLLLTNDGELASALLGPGSSVEKTYHVKVRGKVTDRHLGILRSGVRIGPRTVTREAEVDRLNAKSKHDWLVITLTEGKSRQIHRMLESLNLSVTKLQRVAFAGLNYHGLRVGDARELTQGEVNDLRRLVGLSRSAAAISRGTWSAKREDSEMSRRARSRLRAEREAAETQQGESGDRDSSPRAATGKEKAKRGGAKGRPSRAGRSSGGPKKGRASATKTGRASKARAKPGKKSASGSRGASRNKPPVRGKRPSKPKRRR